MDGLRRQAGHVGADANRPHLRQVAENYLPPVLILRPG
jgi:hypothetical protein